MQIDIIYNNIKEKTEKEATNILEQIIDSNKDRKIPIIPEKLENYINNVRINIPKLTKERAIMSEAISEKISSEFLNSEIFKKRKPGRPKKGNIKLNENKHIEDFFKNSN